MFSVILILSILSYNAQGLRWAKSGQHSTAETVYSLMTSKSPPEIDVSSGNQVTIIKNAKTFQRGITIYCFIGGYSESNPTTFYFCKETDCFLIPDTATLKDNLHGYSMNFTTIFPGKKGVKIQMMFMATTSVDFSGNFYCKANNGAFTIRSNNVEVRDTYYWSLNLFSNTVSQAKTNIKSIALKDLPQVLNCSDSTNKMSASAPRWIKAEFVSMTTWAVCPVMKADSSQSSNNQMTEEKCAKFAKDKCDESINAEICPREVKKMDLWTTFVTQGGDLIFTGLRPATSTNIGSYSLMCMTKDTSEAFKSIYYFYDSMDNSQITNGIVVNGDPPGPTRKLEAISPLSQQFQIYARQIPADMALDTVKPVTIYALYSSSPDRQFQWYKDGVMYSSSAFVLLDRYSITFTKHITSEHAGNYKLEVVDGTDKISMAINVQVLGSPILIMDACMIPLVYVWEGDSTSMSCDYKQRPTRTILQINSQDINLQANPDDIRANLKASNPYLERLNFTISSSSNEETSTLSYKASNLTRSLGQTKFQDQTVTFMVSNDFGMSVKTTSIYVVPLLKSVVTEYPDKYNCTTPCSSADTHVFKCTVSLNEYDNKELSVELFWSINSNRLDDVANANNIFARYFTVDPVSKVLTMNPIKSNNTDNDERVKKALKDNYIECNVNIYPSNREESAFFYHSTSDKTFGTSLRAKVTLDYELVSTAYVYWIIAVILGVIVLIILIVLLTRYCMKNKGDTYPLDKLEREHGYDPEKEVQDEIFKPYEREDHEMATAPGMGEDRRLSMSGHSIGSNDDGELDNYELDPSNFNEDSSIVGKYGANPRSRAEMA